MAKTYNVNFIGNLTNDNGVISGFSSDDYMTITNTAYIPQGRNWELVICITTGNDVSGSNIYAPNIWGSGVCIGITNGNFLYLVGDAGNGWLNPSQGYIATNYSVLTNTTYYLKVTCDIDNSGYYYYHYSLDGQDWVQLLRCSSTNPVAVIPIDLGAEFSGSIDLNKCYLKINDTIVWQGATGQDEPVVPTEVSTLQFVENLVIGSATVPENVTFRFSDILKLGGGGDTPSWQDIVLSGNGSLTLTNAKANGLNYLKLFGDCEQDGTPTPTVPIDIVCNNGALKMVDNELPTGYKRVLGYECNNNVLWQITGFKLKGSDTVRVSFSINGACNVFGCYQGTDAKDNYDLYVSSSSGAKYLRYADGTYLSYWSPSDMGQRFNVVFSPTGTSGMPQDSTWKEKSFTSENDLLIGSTTLTGTSAKLKGNLYGNFIVEGRLKIIPCERVKDGVLGYYDMYSKTFFEPTGTPTSLGYDGSHYVLTIDGTTEKVEVDTTGGTATAETLLKVGDYQDVQSVLNGVVTRNVGIKVLDGTEDWKSSTTPNIYYVRNSDSSPERMAVLSTHYVGTSELNANMPNNSVKNTVVTTGDTTGAIYIKTSNVADKTAFIEFLANQYANGTPVIVVYPLATPTTETVTGQHLHIQAGTNIVEITQASINNLPLEVSYKGTV